MDRWAFERQCLAQGARRIAGVDEAGRGPLAGPVLAAVAVLPARWIHDGIPPRLASLDDSKKLTPAQRDRLFAFLTESSDLAWATAEGSVELIARINILRATHQAMAEAVRKLDPLPDHVLVDGLPVQGLPTPHTPIVRGDALSFSISAASIIAKVTRDRLMEACDRLYPEYGFAQHKGYGTACHLEAIARHGPCPIHRRNFAPLKGGQLELWR